MISTNADPHAQLRQIIYGLLICISAATITARVFTIESKSKNTPFLSANDRSRWSTICSLVDYGTFSIDDVVLYDTGERNPDWYSIDIVRHKGRDGKEHFYSSKPPVQILPLAAEYWLIKNITGSNFDNHPLYVGRLILFFSNVLPFAFSLFLLTRIVEEFGQSDWGRIFVVAAAAFGTYLTTMAATLNNHSTTAVCVVIATYAILRIWRNEKHPFYWYPIAGFFSASAAAYELPALSFFAVAMACVALKSVRQLLIGFAPLALLVGGIAFATNYIAHDSWRPPYAHRNKDGAVMATVSGPLEKELHELKLPEQIRQKMADSGKPLSPTAAIAYESRDDRWVLQDKDNHNRFAIVRRGDQFDIREWDDWYEFENSYWSSNNLNGVDRGEESKAVYFFHAMLGHHGVFSLTPIWLLFVMGIGIWSFQKDKITVSLATIVATLTLVCTFFYIFMRPLIDRNYGGVSCGFRWLFWLIPLWLIVMIPACDRLSKSRTGRCIATILLTISVFSAYYSATNPWSHPWIFHFWTTLGWIDY